MKKRAGKRVSIWDIIYVVLAAVVVLSAVLIIRSCSGSSEIPEDCSLTVLDVGQGQSVVLTSGRYTAVVDCGSTSISDPGRITGDYLLENDRGHIDLMILSHYHSDHTNGLDQLARMVDIGAILLPQPPEDDTYIHDRIVSLADRLDIGISYISKDTTVSLGDGELTLYAPLGGETENEMTADAPASIEYRLLDHADLPDIEILVAGHHGSAGSTSQDLLDAVTPEAAIISVGENEYGHPAGSLLRRLSENGVAVYRTDESGNITFAPHISGSDG